MKIFQFQNGENTRFLYQESPKKDPVLQATTELNQQTRAMLEDLKVLVLEGNEEKLKDLGWEKTTDRKGKQKWKKKETGETVLFMDKDKDGELDLVKYKDTKKKEKIKTYARDKDAFDPKNIKKIKAKDVTVNEGKENESTVDLKMKYENNKTNDLKKVVATEAETGRTVAKYKDDKRIKTKGNFNEDVVASAIDQKTEDFKVKEGKFEKQINDLLTNYTIQPGDTISDIVSFCRDANGNTPKWKDVYAVNKNNLRSGNPDLIFPGEKLKLPDGYKLNSSALSAKQLVNLNEWYGKKKALEVRAQHTKTVAKEQKATAQVSTHTPTDTDQGEAVQTLKNDETLFQITEDSDFAREMNKLMEGGKNSIESNEKVEPITPDELVNTLNEANSEEASDEVVKKLEDYLLIPEYTNSWKEEDYNKAVEAMGIPSQSFKSFEALTGTETLPALETRSTNISNMLGAVKEWGVKYKKILDKSAPLKEWFDEAINGHETRLKETTDAIAALEKNAEGKKTAALEAIDALTDPAATIPALAQTLDDENGNTEMLDKFNEKIEKLEAAESAEGTDYDIDQMSASVTTCAIFMEYDGSLKKPEDVNTSLGQLDLSSNLISNLTLDDIKYLKRVSNLRIKTDISDVSFLAPLNNITDLWVGNATGIPTTLRNLTDLYAPAASFYLVDFPNLKEFSGANIQSAPHLPVVGNLARNTLVIVNGEIKTLTIQGQKDYLLNTFSQRLPAIKIDNSNIDEVITALQEKNLIIKKMEMFNMKNTTNILDINDLDYSEINNRKSDLTAQAKGVIDEITNKAATIPDIVTKVDKYFGNKDMKEAFDARITTLQTAGI